MSHWLTRCFPGISTIALSAIVWLAFSKTASSDGSQPPEATLWQKVFTFYTMLVHLAIASLPFRTIIGTLRATQQIQSILSRRAHPPSKDSFDSEAKSSGSDNLAAETTFRHAKSPVARLGDQEVIHCIIIPNYKEALGTLRATLFVLATHPRAKSQYEASC
jgi:hypothetical protein